MVISERPLQMVDLKSQYKKIKKEVDAAIKTCRSSRRRWRRDTGDCVTGIGDEQYCRHHGKEPEHPSNARKGSRGQASNQATHAAYLLTLTLALASLSVLCDLEIHFHSTWALLQVLCTIYDIHRFHSSSFTAIPMFLQQHGL